jgi:gluconolactonase
MWAPPPSGLYGAAKTLAGANNARTLLAIVSVSGHFNPSACFVIDDIRIGGNTTDRQGRLVSCEHGGRRVVRTEFDGTITVVADRYNGRRLNSPNDVVVASNGTIWFTDPTYGIGGLYEGLQSEPEQEKHNVYRVDPQTGGVTVVVDDFVQPNGICFSPDEKKLYVIDSGITHGGPAHIRSFDVDIDKGTVSNSKVFAEGFAPGLTDGMRCDIEGNVWCSMGWADPKEDGVRCYTPAGSPVALPQSFS